MFETASAAGRFLMEAMWMKFNPAFRRLHEEIHAGTIGEARNMRAGFSIPWPQDGGTRWQPPAGGALLDQGIYPITLAHTVFGAPAAIQASGTMTNNGVDLAEHVTLDFGDGRFAQISTGMMEFTDCSAAVSGRLGWITLPAPFWATTNLELHAGSMSAIFESPDCVQLERQGHGYVPMLAEAITAIDHGLIEHPWHTASDTVAVLSTIDAIFEQLRS